jgi:hypothetical protein
MINKKSEVIKILALVQKDNSVVLKIPSGNYLIDGVPIQIEYNGQVITCDKVI